MGPAFPIDIAETKIQCQLIPTKKEDFITGGKTCAFCRERHANYYCFGCHHYFHFGKQSCIINTKLQLDVDGLNKKLVTPISCYNFMHPSVFGKPDYFANVELNADKINEIKSKSKEEKGKNNKRKTISTLSTITETETETTIAVAGSHRRRRRSQQTSTTAAGRTRNRTNNTATENTTTITTRMSTRSNNQGRFISKNKRLRR
tara:strand:+ start:7 stop:618 length:612 start_codon:yes stop_codon:yes gene_type:complete